MSAPSFLTALLLTLPWTLPWGAAEPSLSAAKDSACVKDVAFALDALEKECARLIQSKDLEWKKISRDIRKKAKKAKGLQGHYEVLLELTALMQDGHSRVNLHGKAKNKVKWPGIDGRGAKGPGVFLCRIGEDIYIKNAWDAAAKAGVKPGMKVLAIDKKDPEEWLKARMEEAAKYDGYSTEQQLFYWACHWGLMGKSGSKITFELENEEGKKKKAVVKRRNASFVASGPVVPPKKLKRVGRQSYGKTEKGYGYIHLRDTPGELPEQLDTMLKALGSVPGLILDFRANGGGGFDHDGVFGRFLPKGKSFKRPKAYELPSTGDHPYGGPVVVIIDAGVRSAGETGSGMFKEDGRAYMIGESATAGMSASKRRIMLPSGMFELYVSVRSNKGRFNRGKGIEGLGVPPHEVVEYDPEDLREGRDTLIERAEELLADFPSKKVLYSPRKFGWEQ